MKNTFQANRIQRIFAIMILVAGLTSCEKESIEPLVTESQSTKAGGYVQIPKTTKSSIPFSKGNQTNPTEPRRPHLPYEQEKISTITIQ